MQYKTKKRFGQHFLVDDVIIQNIIRSIQPNLEQGRLIEIGPGMGALTKPLLDAKVPLTLIEIDNELAQYWRTYFKSFDIAYADLLHQDALSIDYIQLGSNLRIIGNLPYNISTPLLAKLCYAATAIDSMVFMLQKEVVDRMVASPGTKAYGRLSILMQYFFQMEVLMAVPPESFDPPPNVDSAVIKMVPYEKSPYDDISIEALESFTRLAFMSRRKTLRNNLKGHLSEEKLSQSGIDPSRRPETLTLKECVMLARKMVLK